MFTDTDLYTLKEKNISIKEITNQLEHFERGTPHVDVVRPATIDDGIAYFGESLRDKYEAVYEKNQDTLEIVKFVPASGAATRMFKFLHQFLNDYNPDEERLEEFFNKDGNRQVEVFFNNTKHFAFTNLVRKKIREIFPQYKQSTKGERFKLFVRAMLEEKGLNFSDLPKGLIPFHRYTKLVKTAFEEQLFEAAYYAVSRSDAFLHFTFSEEHTDHFKKEFSQIENRISKQTKIKFHISYSYQHANTDTLAVTKDNKPFRDEKGKLFFRPGGHGALLNNLNDVDADLIFIKNIDNVVCEEFVEEIASWKRILAGKLVWLQQQMFNWLEKIEADSLTEEDFSKLKSFVSHHLGSKNIPTDHNDAFKLLNRPVRVCGMVQNTGAPGGGPFWVKDGSGQTTLQIVELSQVDMENPRQRDLVTKATHFNPVDIVCGVRDFKGNKFDLMEYCDPDSVFIANKTIEGEPIKALERPGLWNGSMAYWNTIFVEVPLITFNPVKTVNDLLTKEHTPNL